MPRLLIPALALTSSPAFAHSGAHLHPHGSGNWLTAALSLGILALAATLMALRK